MIAKKNPRYDLERKRFAFFQVGLLTVGSLTLAAFVWESPTMQERVLRQVERTDVSAFEYTEQTKKEEPQKVHAIQDKKEVLAQLDIQRDVSELSLTTKNNSSEVKSHVSVSSNVKMGTFLIVPQVKLPDLTAEIIEGFPDKDPSYQGGYLAMQTFVGQALSYPQPAIEAGIEGKVYVGFVVEKDGSISQIKILRGVDRDLDREALRLVRQMPTWIPGEKNGKKVRTSVRLPIVFKLR